MNADSLLLVMDERIVAIGRSLFFVVVGMIGWAIIIVIAVSDRK